MSRSYKKNPVFKDNNKGMKKAANCKVHRTKFCIANGNAYRKVFCSYDISDYSIRETFAEYCFYAEMRRIQKFLEKGIGNDSKISHYRDWIKYHSRK